MREYFQNFFAEGFLPKIPPLPLLALPGEYRIISHTAAFWYKREEDHIFNNMFIWLSTYMPVAVCEVIR